MGVGRRVGVEQGSPKQEEEGGIVHPSPRVCGISTALGSSKGHSVQRRKR